MPAHSKRVRLVAGLLFTTCVGYWSGLFVDVHSGTYHLLTRSKVFQARTGTESVVKTNISTSFNSSTGDINPNHNLNQTLFVTHYKLNDGHRLGNQMFRYASLLGIARTQGRELVISSGSDVEKIFKLQHVIANVNSTKWPTIREVNAYIFDTRLMNLPHTDISVKGYLQSFKYFADVADEVRREFTFQDSIANAAALILYDVNTKYKGSLVVGVQVRRGDFKKDFNIRLGYIIPEKSYFVNAFNFLRSKFPGRNVTFLVVSDDLPWCNQTLAGEGVIIAPPASAAVHMAVLASCDHVIITSGSYSWWSGWLSGGHVIYFTGFMKKNTTFGNTFSSQDYYPSLWTGLGN